MTLESPPLTCVVKDKPYAVSISIEGADGSRSCRSIDTTMISSQDQSILPDRPLVIGPLYEPTRIWPAIPTASLPGEPKPRLSGRIGDGPARTGAGR